MQPIAGMCPLCHAEGRTGKPCRQPVCERHGYHFVPIEYFDSHRARPSHRRDSVIGLCADDYLIVDELGEGGFGKVYLALLLPVYMKVALKLLVRAERSPRSELMLLETFEREAMSLAQLNHPNIVRLLKYGAWKGKPYLVTEFVDNARTLKAEFESQVLRNEAFEPAAVRHILDQLLNALNNAHAKQIVHRDIKPDNIMLQEIDGDPYFVRVLDFGLAKFAVGGDHISTVVGTPRYMSPEQLGKSEVGPYTDLYAIGILAYEMLSGRRPFTARTVEELIAQKIAPEYDPMIPARKRGLPENILSVLEKAIARDPKNRYANAIEFKEALAKAFNDMLRQRSFTMAPTVDELLDEDERRRLSEEQQRVEDEERKLREARRRLEEERRRFEAEIRQFRRLTGEFSPERVLSADRTEYPPTIDEDACDPQTIEVATSELSLEDLSSGEFDAPEPPSPELEGKSYDELAAMAKTYVRNGDWFNCLRVYAQMIRVTPEIHLRVEIYYRRAKVLQTRLGNKAEAENHYRYALQLNPLYRPAFTALKELYSDGEEWDELLALLLARENAVGEARHKAELLSEIAEVYETKLQNTDRALVYLDQALQQAPTDATIRERALRLHAAQSNWARVAELGEGMLSNITLDADHEAMAIQLARAHEALGRFPSAQKTYQRILEHNPQSLEALKGLARLHVASRYWDRALEIYKRLFALHRSSLDKADLAQIYCHLGLISHRLGETESALAYLKKAHKADVRHVETLELLVDLLESRGEWRMVIHYITQLVAVLDGDDERFRLLMRLGELYGERLRDLSAAIESYRSALQYDPTAGSAVVKLAETYLEAGRYESALELLKRVTENENDPERLCGYLETIATIYYEHEQDDERAVEFYNRSLDANANNLHAFEAIDRLLTARGDWKQLALNYRKMIRRTTRNAETSDLLYLLYRNLGEVYRRRLKDPSRAQVAWQNAVKIRPDDIEMLLLLCEVNDELLAGDEGQLNAAVESHRALVWTDPRLQEPLHRLNEHLMRAKMFDECWCGASIAVALGFANPRERTIVERYTAHTVPRFRQRLDATLWQEKLYHSQLDPDISAILDLVCEAVYHHTAPAPERARLKRGFRVDLADRSEFSQLASSVLYVLGLKAPEIYILPESVAPSLLFATTPALIVSEQRLSKVTPKQLAFRLARQLSYLLPTFYLATANSDEFLTRCIYAAVQVVIPDYRPPNQNAEQERVSASLNQLNAGERKRLERGVRRLRKRTESTLDVNRWLKYVERTADRAALLVTNDLTLAMAEIKSGGGADEQALERRALDLARFAISDAYHELRRHVGIALSD